MGQLSKANTRARRVATKRRPQMRKGGSLVATPNSSVSASSLGVNWSLEAVTRTSGSKRKPYAYLGACKLLAWVLIGLAALMMLISPLTENMRGFDNFPRGGQDFELSMLITVVMLCMVVLAVFLGLKLAERLFKKTSCKPHEFWIVPMSFFGFFLIDMTVWAPPKQQIELGAFAAPLRN